MPFSFDLPDLPDFSNKIVSEYTEEFTIYESPDSENLKVFAWPKSAEPPPKEFLEKSKIIADNVAVRQIKGGGLELEAASPEQSEKLQEFLAGKEVTVYDSSGNILQTCTITIILSSEAKQALKAKYEKEKQKSEESTEKSKVLTQKTEERRVLKKRRSRIQRIQKRAKVALREIDEAFRKLGKQSFRSPRIKR